MDDFVLELIILCIRGLWVILCDHHCKPSVQGPLHCETTSVSHTGFEGRNRRDPWSAGEVVTLKIIVLYSRAFR